MNNRDGIYYGTVTHGRVVWEKTGKTQKGKNFVYKRCQLAVRLEDGQVKNIFYTTPLDFFPGDSLLNQLMRNSGHSYYNCTMTEKDMVYSKINNLADPNRYIGKTFICCIAPDVEHDGSVSVYETPQSYNLTYRVVRIVGKDDIGEKLKDWLIDLTEKRKKEFIDKYANKGELKYSSDKRNPYVMKNNKANGNENDVMSIDF